MNSILLVGCGKMGGAMLSGWLDRGLAASAVTVVEPDARAAQHLRETLGVSVLGDPDQLAADYRPDMVVFAVKPQLMGAVVPPYRRFAGTGAVFLSIAAGTTIGFFENHLGDSAAIVRAMPNTPAAVRQGITVACPNGMVTADQRAQCQERLEAVGTVLWTNDESHMDGVTAVSGSGPAYVFLLAEALAAAGRQAGLNADMADQLARQTVSGAGVLLAQSSETPATLRENVTSPNGTTAAALAVLMAEPGLQDLMTAAVRAAAQRSRELAG